jgi:ribosomal-protein-alanine N-acetyltransferase
LSVAYEVRLARLEDVAGVLRVEQASREAPHWDDARYRAMLDADEGALRRALWVAIADGNVIGFAAVSVVLDEAELESIAVEQSWRKRGVGRALSEAMFLWVREAGAMRMRLEVRASNVGAQALYKSFGFIFGGVRCAYYSEPVEDALLFARTLLEVS